MRHAVARQDEVVRIAPSRVRRRPSRSGSLFRRGRIRPCESTFAQARAELVWPEPGARVPDELLLALMA